MRDSAEDVHLRHSVAVALSHAASARDVELDVSFRRGRGTGDAPTASAGEWEASERARFERLSREPPRPSRAALLAGRSADLFGGETARARCMRLARAALAGRVPAGERGWMEAALGDGGDAFAGSVVSSWPQAGAPAASGAPAGPVRFAFARPVAARGGTAAARGEGLAMVREVDPDDAPVACRLARPGGHLAVRSHAGAFIRPVLSPGSWEPMGMAGFAEAAASAPAWVDNPFNARPADGAVAVGLDDLDLVPSPAGVAARALGRSMADAAILRAGPLCLVDGVVHRSAPAPVLGLAARHLARGRGGRDGRRVDSAGDGGLATWWMGGLHMLEAQGTMRPTWWDVDHQLWFPTSRDLPCVHGTPADAVDLATLAAASPSRGPWHPGDPVAVDVDPACFPSDGRFALRTLAGGDWPLAPDARALVAAALSGAGDAAALRELGRGAGEWDLGRHGATRAVEALLGLAAAQVEALDPWVAAGMPGL